MTMRARQNTASRSGWLTSTGLPASIALVITVFVLSFASEGWALGPRGGGFHAMGNQHGSQQHANAPQSHAAPAQAHPSPSHAEEPTRTPAPSHPNTQPANPGQQH